jgi:hypothetical protein
MSQNVQGVPVKCKELINALADNMWSFVVNHGKDTVESPYVSIEAARGGVEVRVTWHTRATGTYRLFSCMVKKRDVTLTKALEAVRA